MRFEAVLFDMDGTLADTLPDLLRVFNALLGRYGVGPFTAPELVSHFGPTEEEILQKLLPSLSRDQIVSELMAELGTAEPIACFRGMRELVLACKRAGYRVGVFTGAGRLYGGVRLRRMGLEGVIDGFVAGDDVATRKPEPEGLLLLCERVNAEPRRAVYIGDSPLDIRCAHAAGAHSVAVTWGVNPIEKLQAVNPGQTVSHVDELARFLGVDPTFLKA